MPSAVSRLRSQLLQNGAVVDEMMPNGGAVRQLEAIRRRRTLLDDRRHAPVVGGEARKDLLPRDDGAGRPLRRAADVHVLDEPDFGAHRLSVLDQIHDLVVVDAADDDRVDLERAAEHALRRGHSFVHAGELVESRERLEPVGTQRVQADGDAAQAGGRERVGVLGEQDAVGRQREVVEAAACRTASSRVRGGRAGAAARRPSAAGDRRLRQGRRRRAREISSKCRTSSRGSQLYSSSGMQYSQRRLHRSVTDRRRLRSGRPRRSACTSPIMTDASGEGRRATGREAGSSGPALACRNRDSGYQR